MNLTGVTQLKIIILLLLCAVFSTTSSDAKNIAESDSTTNGFASQKGKLEWPIKRPKFVSANYAKDRLALYTPSPGYFITCDTNTDVYAVAEGIVTSVFKSPEEHDSSDVVVIRHGNYFTVYTPLYGIQVKTGDIVHKAAPIGKVKFVGVGTTLNFQIWKRSGNLTNIEREKDWLIKWD